MAPFCGITFYTAPGFRLDASNLVLTSIKGAMRYPDFLTATQLPLMCKVLGQQRSTELIVGMLDLSAGKVVSSFVLLCSIIIVTTINFFISFDELMYAL